MGESIEDEPSVQEVGGVWSVRSVGVVEDVENTFVGSSARAYAGHAALQPARSIGSLGSPDPGYLKVTSSSKAGRSGVGTLGELKGRRVEAYTDRASLDLKASSLSSAGQAGVVTPGSGGRTGGGIGGGNNGARARQGDRFAQEVF